MAASAQTRSMGSQPARAPAVAGRASRSSADLTAKPMVISVQACTARPTRKPIPGRKVKTRKSRGVLAKPRTRRVALQVVSARGTPNFLVAAGGGAGAQRPQPRRAPRKPSTTPVRPPPKLPTPAATDERTTTSAAWVQTDDTRAASSYVSVSRSAAPSIRSKIVRLPADAITEVPLRGGKLSTYAVVTSTEAAG